ncbi:MAG: hypothetical protein EBZ67_05775 [Chitinophagia bacterium]|nr:hypothetical protein [Chitinophagia bacterium]
MGRYCRVLSFACLGLLSVTGLRAQGLKGSASMARWDIGLAIGGQALMRVDYRYRIIVLAPEWRVRLRQSGRWRWEGMVQPMLVRVVGWTDDARPTDGHPWESGLSGGLLLGRAVGGGRLFPYIGSAFGLHYLWLSVPRQSRGPAFCSQLYGGVRVSQAGRWALDVRAGFRHVSNAGMSSPNGGINDCMFRLGVSRRLRG